MLFGNHVYLEIAMGAEDQSPPTYPVYETESLQPNSNDYAFPSSPYPTNAELGVTHNEIPRLFQNSILKLDMAEGFHLISIICAILSFITFCFLFEILPAILFFFMKKHLHKQGRKHLNIFRFNVLITIGVCLYFCFLFAFFLLIDMIFAVMYIFLIPFVIVCVGSLITRPVPVKNDDLQTTI